MCESQKQNIEPARSLRLIGSAIALCAGGLTIGLGSIADGLRRGAGGVGGSDIGLGIALVSAVLFLTD